MQSLLAVVLVAAVLGSARAGTLEDFTQLEAALATAGASVQQFGNDASNIMAQTSQAFAASQASVVSAIGTSASSSLAPITDRLANLESLAADFQRGATVDVPVFIAKLTAAASQRIVAETTARQSVNANLSNVIANIVSSANSAFPSASTSRANIWAQMSNARNSIVNSASATLANVVAGEVVRAGNENSQQTAAFNAVNLAGAAAQSTLVQTETLRANSYCASKFLAAGASLKTDTTGVNDYQNCTSAQLGRIYYSSDTPNVFFCDGVTWSTLTLGGFWDSAILTTKAMQSSLASKAGVRWVKCYQATRDGFSGYVAKTRCSHSTTMLIVKSSISGYFFGAYSNIPFEHRNMYFWGKDNWLWRFNPGTTTLQQAVLSGYNNYAIYDYSPYGPTYGGGHDIYLSSGMNSGYTNPSSYVAGVTGGGATAGGCGGGSGASWSFTQSALAGTYSFTATEVEWYYQL